MTGESCNSSVKHLQPKRQDFQYVSVESQAACFPFFPCAFCMVFVPFGSRFRVVGENDPVLVAKYMCNVEGIGSICIRLIRFDKGACSPSWTKMLK